MSLPQPTALRIPLVARPLASTFIAAWTSPSAAIWPLLLVGGAALMVAPWLLYVIPDSDDGLIAGQAMLISSGHLPYRDFFCAAPALTIAVYGVALKAFGSSYLVFRLVTGTILVAGGGLLYVIARCLTSRPWALGVALAWTSWLAMYIQAGPYHYLGVTAMLGATAAFLHSRQTARPGRWEVLSGVCAGLAVQALPTMVLAAAALEVAVLLTARRRWRAGASVMAGGVASLLPFLVFIVATGTVAGFYEQAIAWTTGPYLRAHPRVSPLTPLPDWPAWYFAFPTRLLVLFTVFLVPAAVLLLPLWAWLRRRRYRLRREVVAIGVISSGLFLAESYRAGTPLLWYAAPLALLLAVCAGRSLLMRLAPRLPQLGLLLALPLLAALGPAAIGAAQHLRVGSHPGWQAVHASAVDVYSDAPAAAAMQTVIDFSRAHRQDGIAYYPALETMYLLSGQPPRVFYLTILPGVFTEQQVQAEESDLQAKQVRYLVYRRLPRQFLADVYPGAESALQGRQWEFETFIASNYREVQTLAEMRDRGSVVLYERR